jgi:Domain of unknown function (DUF3576)
MNKNLLLVSPLLLFCAGCSIKETKAPESLENQKRLGFGSILGSDGISFGKSKNDKAFDVLNNIKVNPYLWKASLEVLESLPLVSADSSGGVIVTDWYVDPMQKKERLKFCIYINDIQLRSDAIKVKIYKQVKYSDDWIDSKADQVASIELENVILSRAREIKIRKNTKY